MVHADSDMSGGAAGPEAALAAANRRLARALQRSPLPLTAGAAQTLRDPLWVWGVLGGKDVGKSSLINALAGGEVAEPSATVGEGTYRPAVYLSAQDEAALRSRLGGVPELAVVYRSGGPQSLRGLALVDLPDFDSLFEHHVDQVRRIAGVLDGIIWVTTPKKVADLRAIREIRGVLKDRTNFIYVVNKIDWLLAQSEQPPEQALARLRGALQAQIRASGESNGAARTFLISARYRDSGAIVQAIGRSRNIPDGTVGPELAAAAVHLQREFEALRQVLTTAPSGSDVSAGKHANLNYQVGHQARQVLEHFQPQRTIQRLEHELGDGRSAELVHRSFPAGYCRQLLGRLNSEKELLVEWTAALVRRRMAYWPMVGVVALPVVLIMALVQGLRAYLPGSAIRVPDDPFRSDGLALEDRIDAILDGLRRAWSRAVQGAALRLPDSDPVAHQFRQDARALASNRRESCIAAAMQRRPTWIGRAVRWILPVAILLWFPVVQPLLAVLLAAAGGDSTKMGPWLLVETLSAGQVLSGLVVALLILALIAGGVYARALRDALAAVDRLAAADPGDDPVDLLESLLATVSDPIATFREELVAAEQDLRGLAGLYNGPQTGATEPVSTYDKGS